MPGALWPRRMVRLGLLGVAAMTLAVPGILLTRGTTGHDWYAAGKLTAVEVALAVGFSEYTAVAYRWKESDPQIRHLDHAWASTVHAFQGRTVDNVIAVMEAKHPKLSTQKSFYVEISRARHNAELVTDDAKELRETLEAVTGERVSALEGIGAADRALAEEKARGSENERGRGLEAMLELPAGARDEAADKAREPEREKVPEPERTAELDKSWGSRGIEMEM